MSQNEGIIYKSEFSIVPFIGLIVGISGFGYAGFILLENYKNIGGIILILPGLFFILSALSLTALLSLKSVIFTQKKLIFKYIFIPKKYEIDWNEINDLKVKFAALRINDGYDYAYKIVYTGKDLKIYFNKKSILLESFCYLEFEELLSKFGKRITPALNQKMKSTYKRSEKKFWQEDDKYWRILNKIVLPFSLGILILILLLKL
tara:strand:+ start:45 stop:659 length:615 start_codon:yes stop_codon:yes gene_type:complete